MSAALKPEGDGRAPPTPVTPLRPPWASAPLLSRNLSPRQIEVARLCAKGLSYRAIAAELGCSHNTVKRHVDWIILAIPSAFCDAEERIVHGCTVALWVYRVERGEWPQRTPDELRAAGAI